MPKYTNSNLEDVMICQSPYTVLIPADSDIETNFYIRSLPSGVTLTDHAPLISPWVLLDTVSSVPSSEIVVSSYKSIVIYNASDDVVTASVNGDDDNAIVLMAASKEVWNNSNGAFGSVTVLTNAGSGSVYVWGAK